MVAIQNIAVFAAAASMVAAYPQNAAGFQRMEVRQLAVADDLIHLAETFLKTISGTLDVLTQPTSNKQTQLQNLESALDSLNKQIPELVKDIAALNLPVISGIAGTLASVIVNPIFKTLALVVEQIAATLASIIPDGINGVLGRKIFQNFLTDIQTLISSFAKIFPDLGDVIGSLTSATSSLGSVVSKLPATASA